MATFDIYYKYGFEWDPEKAASNLRKHGVSFGEAMTAFDDPDRLLGPDHRHSTPKEIRGVLADGPCAGGAGRPMYSR